MPTYQGPKDIVIIGGGIAGLAACDAVTSSLADFKTSGGMLPAGLKITLVEGEDQVGGRATTWKVSDTDAAEHPQRHFAGHTPHGIHFLWHSYAHFLEWTKDATHVFSPETPTSTYNMWITPPDLPEDFDSPGAVVAVHVVDPKNPQSAWDPRARTLLEAFLREDTWVKKLEAFVRHYLAKDIAVDDWLAFLDMLFDEKHLSPQLRWGLFFGPIFAAEVGRVETNPNLAKVLGGRAPQDVEVGELMQPLFDTVVVQRLREAHDALAPYLSGDPTPTSFAPLDSTFAIARNAALKVAETAFKGLEAIFGRGGHDDVAQATLELFQLIARDARVLTSQATSFDPKRSGYLKNLYKAAFSSPYSFDLATAIRDIQMGHRNFQCAKLQVFDGDDAQALWNHIRARIEKRKVDFGIDVTITTGAWANGIDVDASGRVRAVKISASATRAKRPVSTVDPVTKGPTTTTLPADAVVCTLLPACAKALLPKGAGTPQGAVELRRRLDTLSVYANETVNLQIFLDRRIELPFLDGPVTGPQGTPPFSISNLEGPFTILVDLKRAWRKSTYEAIRLTPAQTAPFAGTAWEMVGAWGDVFTHDDKAAPARAQWPLGMQEILARLAQDPLDLEPWSIDGRAWVVDQKRLTPPAFGEVKRDPAVRAAYFDAWVKDVSPIVVQQTLRLIAQMPGLAPDDVDHLKEVADQVGRHDVTAPIRWVFTKSAQAETKFHSSEPRMYASRPHARFETSVPGLWLAGDWVRSGLNVQCMEGALISGLQSAAGLVEAMRAGGMTTLNGPKVMPDMVPNGAWDAGS